MFALRIPVASLRHVFCFFFHLLISMKWRNYENSAWKIFIDVANGAWRALKIEKQLQFCFKLHKLHEFVRWFVVCMAFCYMCMEKYACLPVKDVQYCCLQLPQNPKGTWTPPGFISYFLMRTFLAKKLPRWFWTQHVLCSSAKISLLNNGRKVVVGIAEASCRACRGMKLQKSVQSQQIANRNWLVDCW